MNFSLLQWVVVTGYVAALACQLWVLRSGLTGYTKFGWNFFALLGCLSQGWVLHQAIDLTVGQNLSYPNVSTLIVWLSIVMLLVASVQRPLHNLGLFLFPLAIMATVMQATVPVQDIQHTGRSVKEFVHVWLAVLSLSVLCLAALQALFVALQDRLLRSRYATNGLFWLPPLESMEVLLFQLILLGFACLSVMLISSFIFFSNVFKWPLLQQTIMTTLAWAIFATITWGHLLFGWRGRIASRWIILGALLLIVSYFGRGFI